MAIISGAEIISQFIPRVEFEGSNMENSPVIIVISS